MAFYHFTDPCDPEREAFGSCEVFYVDGSEEGGILSDGFGATLETGEVFEPGWYWQACFPGCLPDGSAMGPFASEDEAMADAGVAP